MNWTPKAACNEDKGKREQRLSQLGEKTTTQSVEVGCGMAGAGEGKLAHVTLKVSSWGILADDEVGSEGQDRLLLKAPAWSGFHLQKS